MPEMLTDKAVAAMVGAGRTTIWRWVEDGRFPKPIRLSNKCTRWRRGAVEAWINAKERQGVEQDQLAAGYARI